MNGSLGRVGVKIWGPPDIPRSIFQQISRSERWLGLDERLAVTRWQRAVFGFARSIPGWSDLWLVISLRGLFAGGLAVPTEPSLPNLNEPASTCPNVRSMPHARELLARCTFKHSLCPAKRHRLPASVSVRSSSGLVASKQAKRWLICLSARSRARGALWVPIVIQTA